MSSFHEARTRGPRRLAPASLRASGARFAAVFWLLACILIPAAVPALAQQQPAQPRESRQLIDAGRAELQQIEAALQRDSLDDTTLALLRARVEPLIVSANEIVARETPRLEAIKARLEQLGPKPEGANAAPESAEAAREREAQEKAQRDIDETLRSARLLAVTAEQVQQAIVERRRAMFTRAILQRSQSVASPWLWLDVADNLPRDLRALRFVFTEWRERVVREMTGERAALLLALLAAVIGAVFAKGALVRRFGRQDAAVEAPTRLQRASAALRVATVYALVPSVTCIVVYNALFLLDMLPGRVSGVAWTLLYGIALLYLLRGLAGGALAVDRPAWRFFAVDDERAARLLALTTRIGVILLIGKTIEALNQAIVAALPLTQATKGAFATLIALIIVSELRAMAARPEDEPQADGPALPPESTGDSLPLRLAAWLVATAVLVAAVTGYLALAGFLVDQLVSVIVLGTTVALLVAIADEAVGKGLASDGRLGRQLRMATGLTRNSVDQIGVLAAGLMKVLLFALLGLLVLAPWGVDSGDLLGSMRTAFFGFEVGNVTISLSAVLIAIGLFLAGFFLTRTLQNWLETRYLPHTTLDPGLRNSIRTALGYIGVVVAAAVALGQLGLSLDRIAIVAGALSLGIGLGLQSIANNFVSGLILLWERPLRVGDWIAVGTEQGKVKRINVRATEIETFDKASLIVPNSAFISGQVKNFAHTDRIGRIVIPVGVSYDSDPEEVRAVLNEVALSHREVLTNPKHLVFFKNFGESSLDFELICFTDIDSLGTVRSELLFDLFRQFKAKGISLPYPHRTVQIANPGALAPAPAADDSGSDSGDDSGRRRLSA